MSHYSVLVAVPGTELCGCKLDRDSMETRLEEILAPYFESTEDKRFLTFEDCTDECKQEYETGTCDFVQYPDGTMYHVSDPRFTDKFKIVDGKIYCATKRFDDPLVETDESKAITYLPNQPVKNKYSFEAYCREYMGYYEAAPGCWGYKFNPNAKWDWFEIGGRWAGPMLAKKDLPDALYAVEAVNDPTILGDYCAIDGAWKKDIAWDMMKKIRTDAETKSFFKLQAAFLRHDVSDLGPLTALEKDGIYGWGELLYVAGESLDEYLERKGMNEESACGLFPYACVDILGVWHAQGEMSWFGLSSHDKAETNWHEEVNAFIESLSDDYLVVVDCHI